MDLSMTVGILDTGDVLAPVMVCAAYDLESLSPPLRKFLSLRGAERSAVRQKVDRFENAGLARPIRSHDRGDPRVKREVRALDTTKMSDLKPSQHARLQAHRHHDVFCVCGNWRTQQATVVGVREANHHVAGL